MDISKYFEVEREKDPTWDIASEHVRDKLLIASEVIQVVRQGWNRLESPERFLKLACGCRLNVGCLLDAAGIFSDGRRPHQVYLGNAVSTLGLSYSSVVLAVNLLCRVALKSKPPSIWRSLFKEMMTSVEIGHRLGSKVSEMGAARGALAGFAEFAGQCILLLGEPKKYQKWFLLKNKHKRVGRKIEVELFGCELYQVSAFSLQTLGFGVEPSVGTVLGAGRLSPQHLSLERGVLRWKAAYEWIAALRAGLNYPADLEVRNFFAEVTPTSDQNEKNIVLGSLYAEVARLRAYGSEYTWHLPLPSYEKTIEEWDLLIR